MMSKCLRPITLNKPGLSLSPHQCPVGFWRDNIRPYRVEQVTVPCGKCINCLKNRQDAVMVRCMREAEAKGSFAFVTLTYDDNHLPLAKSLWKVNTDSGELTCLSPAEILCEAQDDSFQSLRCQFRQIKASSSPRYIDLDFFQGNNPLEGFNFFCRVTPTVCRRDVRLWLKRSRVKYEREHGFKLSPFSYIVVSEYGPLSCRPHYHLAFFGLNRLEVNWLCNEWTFGFSFAKMVSKVNDDNSPGWQKAARYIGKYMSKGKFECQSVKECLAEKPRICQSHGIGTTDIDKLMPFLYCWDMFGEFDPDSLSFKSGAKLTAAQLSKICEELPKRLFYRVSSKSVVALPRFIRNKLFYKVCDHDKTKKTPFKLWYLVACSIRDRAKDLSDREFREFLSGYSEGEISKAVSEFAFLQEFSAEAAERLASEKMVDFYSKSRF